MGAKRNDSQRKAQRKYSRSGLYSFSIRVKYIEAEELKALAAEDGVSIYSILKNALIDYKEDFYKRHPGYVLPELRNRRPEDDGIKKTVEWLSTDPVIAARRAQLEKLKEERPTLSALEAAQQAEAVFYADRSAPKRRAASGKPGKSPQTLDTIKSTADAERGEDTQRDGETQEDAQTQTGRAESTGGMETDGAAKIDIEKALAWLKS